MSENGRGERLVTVSRPVMADLLKTRPAVETTLPDDAELEELWHHEGGNGYVFRLSSTEWDALDEGEPIPETEVTVHEKRPMDA